MKHFEVKHEFELEKNGRCYAHNSTEARKLQKEHKEHLKEIKELENIGENCEKSYRYAKQILKQLKKTSEIKVDYFKQRFCDVIDKVNLERQVYHSGAIVGNDVNKLTKTANMKNFPMFSSLQSFSCKMVHKRNFHPTRK